MIMTPTDVLKRMKVILEDAVKDIRLEKAVTNSADYKLVKPNVNMCYVPPSNVAFGGYTVPGITVFVKGGADDHEETKLSLMIGIQTYDPGTTNERGELKYSTDGYTDILNLIDIIRVALKTNRKQLGLDIEEELKWGFFEEQIHPFWTGFIELEVRLHPIANPDLENML